MKTIVQSIALLCLFTASLHAVEIIQMGDASLGMRSLEQVLDDGAVAVIATPVPLGSEDYRGAYLVRKSGVLMLSPYKNMPDPLNFNWYRDARNLAGEKDGSAFWCLSYDQTGEKSFGDYIHYYDTEVIPEVKSPASAVDGVQKIYLSDNCNGDDAVATSLCTALLYGGTEDSKLGFFDKQTFTPSGEAFNLPDNSGLNPAVTSDLQTIFYLAKGEGKNLILRKYDLKSGETEDLVVIGNREKLGLYNGEFLSDQHAVCCSADGGVVVYRYQETNKVKLGIAVEQDDGTYQCQVLDGTLNATSPAISANGQFIFYRQEGGVYRCDLQTGGALLVSSEKQILTMAQPTVSPSGRYVSYFDDSNLLWRGDCGASIEITDSDGTLVVGQNASAELAFEVNGASDNTVISWNLVDEAGALPGKVFYYNEAGETVELQAGTTYSVSTLPWSFQGKDESATCAIRLTVDSYSINYTIVVSDFLNLTKASEATHVCKFNNLTFTDATKLYVETNVWGNGESDMSPWNYDIAKQEWTEVSQIDPKNGVFTSADGATKAWVDENGTLKVCFCYDEENPIDYATDIAELCGMSRDGREVVYKAQDTNGILHFYGGNVLLGVNYELTGIPAGASNVVFAENGRCVMWTAVPDGGKYACLYRMDVDVLKKISGDAVCLTPEVVRNVLTVAVAPSARYAAVPTAADLENAGKTTASRVNLFQWTDAQWTNHTPSFGITGFGEMDEDTTKEFGLHMSDQDGDALVPGIVKGGEHGTAKILPPSDKRTEYMLRYTPEADFYGEDQVTLSLSDGAVTRTSTISVTVLNVNDEPVWGDNTPPKTITVDPLVTTAVPLVAEDPDTKNPTPDKLEYSLTGTDNPKWAAVTSNGDNTGTLILTPGLKDSGDCKVTVQVSDGTETVSMEIAVKVSVPREAEIPVAVMRNASKSPKTPTTYAEHLQAMVAGCWEELAVGKWHALSLPGDTDIARLCTALGCDRIYLYQDSKYQASATGTLLAGTGFWAMPTFPDAEAVIPLTPAASDDAEGRRFVGPAWNEEASTEKRYQPEAGIWQQTSDWQTGRGYFRK